MAYISLIKLGWSKFFSQHSSSNKNYKPARVFRKHNRGYDIVSEDGVFFARIGGKLKKSIDKDQWPAIGDWVECSLFQDHAIIENMLPRKSKISRKVSGKTSQEQVIAVNADTIFLVVSLFEDFNVRKIERYLTLISESKANPVIILNKVDLIDNIELFLQEMDKLVQDTPIIVTSALDSLTLKDELDKYTSEGQTTVFLGTSGAGKSTIVNLLLGTDRQLVNRIGKHKKGQHTTTSRDMLFLENGGILIDNPGIRELRIWLDGDESLNESFADIDLLSKQCRFRDCKHLKEPDCMVQNAVIQGILDQERVENWRKLNEESAELMLKRQAFGRHINSQSNTFAKWTKTARKNNSKRDGLR